MITDYKNLPIGKYQEIVKVSRDESLEEIDKQVKIIAILNDMTENQVLDLMITEYRELAAATAFLGKPSPETHTMIADEYKIGDWVLIPVKDFTKVTTAQYIDFQTFCKDVEMYLVELLSTMMVPKGHKYMQDYDVTLLRDDLMESLSVADALSLIAFFFSKSQNLIHNTLSYLLEEAKAMQNQEETEKLQRKIDQLMTLLKDGDGLQM